MKALPCFFLAALLLAAQNPATTPLAAQFDQAIHAAIANDEIPGAVLLVGQKGRRIHFQAYGSRALEPRREPMTTDTIFDAASLTKVVATASALMKLLETGKVRLNDPVTNYLPALQGGKSDITVRHLLTHFSGLRPDLDLKPEWSGYDTGIKLALTDKPVAEPGVRFIYSDINFILLGELVRVVSGKTLPEFVREQVFAPLGMKETMFQPPATLRSRIAPTEKLPGQAQPLRGIVHDPTTRYMNGIAGHAGLFTTAADLARFAEMMLGLGRRGDVKIFEPLTVLKATTPQSPANQPVLRGLGWDIDSPYSGNRGDLYPVGSYGHTGFTGTSLWIDPVSESYVILLANSVHPKLRKAITPLRGKIATIAAAHLGIAAPGIVITGYNETLAGAGRRRAVSRNGKTLTGLDVLAEQGFGPLRNKRVGLITNHTGLDRQGRRNIDLMIAAGVKVERLFSPEHGMAGKEDQENVADARDEKTGIPILSLYLGDRKRPAADSLKSLDALVFDVQDAGARFYTYATTMAYAMEEAAKAAVPVYVLDRPNPITGIYVEGPVLDPELTSFVGYHPIALRHGMTLGELAQLFNQEKPIGAKLEVIRMRNWERGDWFDSTLLTWTDPSPNLRSLNATLLYPGLAMLEYSPNYSVGRGTDAPFQQVGADFIRGEELALELNRRMIPGVRVYATRFTPQSSRFAGQTIEGVRFVITDREALHSARLGLEIAAALEKLYPGKIDLTRNERLIGSRAAMAALQRGATVASILADTEEAVERFLAIRKKYLLYPGELMGAERTSAASGGGRLPFLLT